MIPTEKELIETDFDGLSDAEILVMLLMDEERPVSRSRLQRTAYMYDRLYEPGRWFETKEEEV